MPDQKLQYIIELIKQGDTAGAVKDLQALDNQASKTTEGIGKIGTALKAAASAFVVRELIRFGADTVREFDQAQQAVTKLEGTLRASGQYSARYSKELQELAANLQRVTRFGDDAIVGAEAQLLAFGATRREMRRLIEDTLDLSAGRGLELSAAADLVGKAAAGEFAALSRLGFEIDDNASRSQKLEQVLGQIERRFGGLARAAGDDATAGLAKFKNELSDLKEIMGEIVVTGLQPYVEWWALAATAGRRLGGWQKREGSVADLDAQQRKMREQFEAEAFAALAAGQIGLKTVQAITGRTAIGFSSAGNLVNTDAQQWALQFAISKLRPDLQRKEAEEPKGPQKVVEVTAEQTAARQDLIKLQRELNLATVTGIDHERLAAAEAAQERTAQIAQLIKASGLPAAEQARAQTGLNSLVEEQLDASLKLIELKELTAALAEAEKQDAAERTAQAKLQQVIEQGILELEREQAKEERERLDRARLAATGAEVMKLTRAELAGPRDVEVLQIQREFDQRREQVAAHYAFAREKAQGNAEALAEIDDQEKEARGVLLAAQQQYIREGSEGFQMLTFGAQQFASGLSGAIVKSFREGKFAFQEFAAEFMAQVAQMIMQVLILEKIMAVIRGVSAGARAGGGGVDPGGELALAGGGFAPRMAANGLLGVNEVTQPTYFQEFNVLAGERGREIMAVLASPSTFSMGGIQGVTGKVQGHQLDIVDSAWRAGGAPASRLRFAATGFMGGDAFNGATLNNQPSTGLQGRAVIEIRVSPRAEAEIREQAIEGASLKILNDLHEDSPTSQAVKGLVR